MATTRTPEQWLKRLYARLVNRRPYIEKLWRYYDGEHPLAFAGPKFKRTFGGLFSAYADNWCPLIAHASGQRLRPVGFRFGDNPNADLDAQAIWQANNMDAQAELAILESIVSGCGYATAWFDDDGDVEITVESALAAVVEHHPKNRRVRLAGLRCYMGEDDREHAELFLPDAVYLFVRQGSGSDILDPVNTQWSVDTALYPAGYQDNPLGKVPMVPLENNPRLRPHPRYDIAAQSDLANVIAQQDALNVLVADMLVAAENAAMPQRWALGFEIQRDANNQPIETFKPNQTVWQGEGGPQAQAFGQFATADLSNYVHAIDMAVQHVASQSQVPPHYFFLGGGQPPSGESIRSAEAGLVAKCRSKAVHLGEAFEEMMRICFALRNDPRADVIAAETIWADIETRTEAEHMDAIVKRAAIGVPLRQLWEDSNYTPAQIERFPAMLQEQALLAPQLPAPPVPQPPQRPAAVPAA